MMETFAALVCAHFIGDFILQPSWMIREKRRPEVLLLHIAIIVALSAILLGAIHLPILIAVALTHTLADHIKLHRYPSDAAEPFLLDQAIHLVVIFDLALLFPNAFDNGAWSTLSQENKTIFLQAITLASGFIASVNAGAAMIAKIMGPISKELESPTIQATAQGLANGGLYIGWLERSLIFVLVLSGNPEGVGFLIGAKSILRIGELKDGHDRKLTEYIIIGTMLSFGWGLTIAELTLSAIEYWGMALEAAAASTAH